MPATDYQPIRFDPTGTPVVSVVIPAFNQFAYTYACLESIHRHPPRRPFEIILVDDASTDETTRAGDIVTGQVTVLHQAENRGFVASCNAGAGCALGRYLLFLNNDTTVQDGWLDLLVDSFEQDPAIGIAGSAMLAGDGMLSESGGIIWAFAEGWNWGRGRNPDDPAFSFLRDTDYVSGAALMIERALFVSLDGFDPLYAPGYYEDTDLAFRVRAMGRRVVVQPASRIVHFGGGTAGTDVQGPGMKRFQAINREKFYERWKETLLAHRLGGHNPAREAERTARRSVWFIDETAGSDATMAQVRSLMTQGSKVTWLSLPLGGRTPFMRRLQAIGVECLYRPFIDSLADAVRTARIPPDVMCVPDGATGAAAIQAVREIAPSCRIIRHADEAPVLDPDDVQHRMAVRDEIIRDLKGELLARERQLTRLRVAGTRPTQPHPLLTEGTTGVYADMWVGLTADLRLRPSTAGSTVTLSLFVPERAEAAAKQVIVTSDFAEARTITLQRGRPARIALEVPPAHAEPPRIQITIDAPEPENPRDRRVLGAKLQLSIDRPG